MAVYKAGNVEFDTVSLGALNSFPASIIGLAPTDKAAWDILTTIPAGPDQESKVVFLPQFGGVPVFTAGAEITSGGGNESINGKITHIGFENSTFTALFHGLTPLKESQISELKCEDDEMEVFAINYEDIIYGKRDGDFWKGIKVDTALILKGRNVPGREVKDNNEFGFQLKQTWSHTIEGQAPTNFSPLNY
jgi:hypothetical protein